LRKKKVKYMLNLMEVKKEESVMEGDRGGKEGGGGGGGGGGIQWLCHRLQLNGNHPHFQFKFKVTMSTISSDCRE